MVNKIRCEIELNLYWEVNRFFNYLYIWLVDEFRIFRINILCYCIKIIVYRVCKNNCRRFF